MRHARDHLMAADFARCIEWEAEIQEVLRFEDVPHDNDTSGDRPLGSIESVESVDPDAPLADHLGADDRLVFRAPLLRLKQEDTITTIIADPKCKAKLLEVDRTGGGKSLILILFLTATAFAVSCVSLVIVPLLSLTAIQIMRIKITVQKKCSSEAHHLDNLSPSIFQGEIIPRMDSFHHRSSSVMFCLCSP